jgi:hypothetical protein
VIRVPDDPRDDIFRTVLYRFFSRPDTYRYLEQTLGHAPRINDLQHTHINTALDTYYAGKNTLYTNALILCASTYFGHSKKHQNHIDLFRYMFLSDSFADKVLEIRTMKQLVELLQTYPMIGPFMSYQLANDLCYLDCIAIDPNTYTIAGPGAQRGIRKVFSALEGVAEQDIIKLMYDSQEKEFTDRGYDFVVQAGMRLSLVDCQGLFCELDKYCRVAHPELASTRSRIKTAYSESPQPLTCVKPKKWTNSLS